MHALKNSARAGADVVSPYRTMLLAWLRGMLAALLMTLIILLLAPIAASSAYATTESSDVQANAPPAIAQTIATAETNAVASGDSSSEVTVVSTDDNSAVNETASDLQESKNEQVDSKSSDQASTNADDTLANTNQSIDTSTGAGNSDASAPSNMGDSGYVPAVNPVITDTANAAITPVTDSIAITADDLNNAVGCDYQGVATDLENANQSLALATDTSSTSLDSRGEGNAGISIASTVNITLHLRNQGYGVFWKNGSNYDYIGGAGASSSDTTSITYSLAVDDTTGNSIFGTDLPVLYSNGNMIAEVWYLDAPALGDDPIPITGTLSLFDIVTSIIPMLDSLGASYEIYPDWDREKPLNFQFAPGDTAASDADKQRILKQGLAVSTINANITSPALPTGLSDPALPSNTDYSGGVWTAYYAADGNGQTYTDVINATTKIANSGPGYYSFSANTTKSVNELLGLNTSTVYIPYTTIFFWASFPNTSVSYKVIYDPRGTNTDTAITGSTTAADTVTTDSYTLLNYNSFPSNTFSYTGHTFTGWKVTGVDSSGNPESLPSSVIPAGTKVTDVFTPGTGSTYTFVAQWSADDYDVKWYSHYGPSVGTGNTTSNITTTSASSNPAVTWDDPISIPSSVNWTAGSTKQIDASGNEYTFAGWYFAVTTSDWTTAVAKTSVTNYAFNTSTQVKNIPTPASRNDTAKTISIYAVWTPSGKTYTITYNTTSNKPSSVTAPTVSSPQTIKVDLTASQETYKEGTSAASFRNASVSNYTITWNTKQNGSGTSFTPGSAISAGSLSSLVNSSGALTLYAIYTGKDVYVKYMGTSVGTAPSYTSPASGSVLFSTVGTPANFSNPSGYASGWTFKGWADASGTVYGTMNSSGTQSWTPTNEATSTNPVELYATWEKIQYVLRFDANSGDVYNSSGSKISNTYFDVTDTDGWTVGESGFVTAATNSGYTVKWTYYKFKEWSFDGTSANAITDSTTVDNALAFTPSIVTTSGSTKYIVLKAVWEEVKVTINYAPKNAAEGSVSPTTRTNVSLATGKDGSGTAATSTATSSNTVLFTFSKWTDNGSTSTAYGKPYSSATITPDMLSLWSEYESNSTTTFTFYANFDKATFNYSIEIYAENASGTYVKVDTISVDRDGNALKAEYNDTVSDSTQVGTGNIALSDLYLKNSTSGTLNSNLYTFTTVSGSSVNNLTINTSGNVLKFYYARKTFYVNPIWANAADLPSSLSGATAASYLPSGMTTSTPVRWGQKIEMQDPETPATTNSHSFAWSSSTSGMSKSGNFEFTLDEAGMAALSAGGTANITGTWTKKTFTVTLLNNDSKLNSDTTSSWSGLTYKASSSASTSTVFTKGATLTNTFNYGEHANNPTDGNTDWIPTWHDNSTYKYYFAYWQDTSDNRTYGTLSSEQITSNRTFQAVFFEKISVSYVANGHAKDWTDQTAVIGMVDSTLHISDKLDAMLPFAAFETVGGVKTPKAAAGYKFLGWNYTILPSSSVTGDTQSNIENLPLTQSYTFTAQWEALDQTITYNTTGSTNNNPGHVDSVTLTWVNTPSSTVKTDAVVPLPGTSDVTGFDTDAYELWGWTDGTTDYQLGTTTLTMPAGPLTLTPVFHEKTVNVYYRTSGESSHGTISGAASETVFAKNHNTVTAHTASVVTADQDGYVFDGWLKDQASAASPADYVDTNTTDSTRVSGVSFTPSLGSSVLTSDITYYAHFSPRTMTVHVNAGTHGTVSLKNTVSSNTIEIAYGTTINGTTYVYTVSPDHGYTLTGWTVQVNKPITSTTSTESWTGGSSDYQGLTTHAVQGNLELTPVFGLSSVANNHIMYADVIDHGTPSTPVAGTSIAWNADVLTAVPSRTPSKTGYTFAGWYADATRSTRVADASGNNALTYEQLVTATGATPDATTKEYTITIYAHYDPDTFYVSYDLWGNKTAGYAYSGESTTQFDALTTNGATFEERSVTWGDKLSSYLPNMTPTRTGYTFKYWYSTLNGSTAQTQTNITYASAQITASDYAYSALAGGSASPNKVVLHAFWEPIKVVVEYVFNDTRSNDPVVINNVGWDTRDNYNTKAEGFEPVWSGANTSRTFGHWNVTYDTSSASGIAGATVNKSGGQTIAELVNNADGVTKVTFTADWLAGVYYKFVDRLVGSTTTDAHNTNNILGFDGQEIAIGNAGSYNADYGTPGVGVHEYVGFTYDSANTPATYTITDGGTNIYYIYYKANQYNVLVFDYTNKTPVKDNGGTGNSVVLNNEYWDSTNVTPQTTTTPSANDNKVTLPSGTASVNWYYEDPDNAGSYILINPGTTTVADIVGTTNTGVGSIRVYVDYVADSVVVKFVVNDSNYATLTGTTSQSVDANDPANAVSPVTANAKPGYKFDGWYYIVDPVSGYTPVATDFTDGTLTAVTATQGTVNVTSGTASATDSSAIQALPFPVSGSATGGNVWQNILYVAHFSPKTYNFTLSNGGFTDVTLPTSSGATGGKAWTDSFVIGEPTRPGFSFAGWESSALGSGTKFDGTSTYTTANLADAVGFNTAITLTATWADVYYRIYYYDDDQTTQLSDVSKREDATWSGTGLEPKDASGSVATPAKLGYTFAGWDTDGDGSVDLTSTIKYSDVAAIAIQNVTSDQYVGSAGDSTSKYGIKLYAVWNVRNDYNVTFNPGNGVSTSEVSGMPGDRTGITWFTDDIIASAPTRDGYRFVSWTVLNATETPNTIIRTGETAGTGKVYSALAGGSNDKITTVMLLAVWDPVKYRIKYYDDDAMTPFTTLTRTDAVWDNAGLAANSNPTKSGYTFTGWATNDDGSGALDNSTTKYSTIAGNQSVTGAQYVGSTGDSANQYGIKLYATWQANAAFKIEVHYEDASGNDAGLIPIPVSVGFNDTVYYTYNGVTMNVSIDTTTSKVNITPTDVTADGKTAIPASLNMPNAYASGYEYDATKTLAGLSMLTRTLDASVNNADNPYVFTIYYKAKSGYTLVYNANGGAYSDGSSTLDRTPVTWLTDDLGNYAAAAPTKDGYKLGGWTTTFNGNNSYEVVSSDTYGKFAANDSTSTTVTLYAKWVEREYNINYVDINPSDPTDIRVVMSSQNISVSDKNVDPYKWEDPVDFDAPDVSKTYHDSGWKFLGWSTVADPTVDNNTIYTSALYSTLATAQGVGTTDDTESGHAGVTLYAVWAKYVPYSIEYYKPSATVSGTYDLIYNDKTTHDENNPGVEGEDTYLTSTEMNAHRPLGYEYTTTSDSVEHMILTQTISNNVLKVYYEICNDFEIIADYNGGSASGGATSSTTGGLTWFDTPSMPSSGFTRNGYNFSGEWNTQADGLGATFTNQDYGWLANNQGMDDEQALKTPVTLYAMWTEISEYVINYDINNKKNKVGDDTTNPHVITNMSDDKNPVTPDDLENLSWTGALSGLADGNAMDAEPIGYHFGSWNTERDGSGLEVTSATTYEELSNRVRPNGASTKPITLYAQWEEDEVEITYMPDGSGGTVTRSIDKISAVTGTAIGTGSSSGTQLTSVAVANPGWHFVRWRLVDGTNADPVAAAAELSAMAAVSGVNTTSVSGQTLSVAASSDDGILHAATYIAEFEQNDPATLIYDPNGGTGSIDDVTEPYGTILTLADGTDYKRKYYTIAGWNTKADGTGTAYALGYSNYELPEGTTTLYAQWTKNKYPVTVETSTGGGGTVKGTSEDVEYGSTPTDTFTTSANPTPDSGYIFTGWTYTMTDAETGEVTTGTIKDLSELKISGPVSLTAVFEKDPNAVTETETESGSGPAATTTTPNGTNGNGGSSNSGSVTYYGSDAVKTGDSGTGTSGFAFAAIAAILLALLVARRRRDDDDDYASTVCNGTYAGVMKRGTQKVAVGFAVMLACFAVSAICAQNALASETAKDEQPALVTVQEVEENTQVDAVSTDAAETKETVISTAEAKEAADPSEKTDVDDTTDEQEKEDESADKKDKKDKEEETQNNEAAVNADQTPAAAGQQEENGKDEVQPEQVETEDETVYASDDEQDEMPAQESEVPENDAAATLTIAATLETAAPTGSTFDQIDPDTYYLTGANSVFGEYFVLDSSSGYLSLVQQTSSMGPPQQWVITLDSTDAQGNLYRISSASNYYLVASTSGVVSISNTASTDPTAYWRAVVSTLNDQPVVALYNAATFNGSQRALALVAAKDSTGTSVTLTVELLSCGTKTFPDIPETSWLWYYRTANPLDWTITYSDTYGASGSTPNTTVTGGQAATVAGNGFSRPGYTFVSWNTKPNGSGTSYAAGATINYMSYNDGYVLPLYAQWKEATATVTYAASTGGKVGLGTSGSASSNSVSETVGAATGVLTGTSSATFSGASAKASTGYHFGGWSSNGTNAIDSTTASSTTITPTTVVRLTNYADSGSSVAIYHGVTVTANFDANTYTVAYDANGGTGTLSASSVTYGNNDTLSTASSTLSQTGYSFSGWNTKADGSGVSVSDGATLSTSTLNQLISTNALADTNGASTTLYAQWTADPTPVTPEEPEESTVTPEPTVDPVVTPVVTPTTDDTSGSDDSGYSGIVETTPVAEAITQAVEAVAQPALEVTAAATETLVTVGATLAETVGNAADSSTSFVDAITNLTPAEAAQAATTTVTAVAAVSTVAGLVGAGASIAGAIAGASAIGAGAAGAVGAASAADLTAELAAESTLAGGFFVRLRRRIKAMLGMDEDEDEDEDEK